LNAAPRKEMISGFKKQTGWTSYPLLPIFTFRPIKAGSFTAELEIEWNTSFRGDKGRRHRMTSDLIVTLFHLPNGFKTAKYDDLRGMGN